MSSLLSTKGRATVAGLVFIACCLALQFGFLVMEKTNDPQSRNLEAAPFFVIPDRVNLSIKTQSSCHGKQEIVNILSKAQSPTASLLTETCSKLPTWKQIKELYGDGHVVIGTKTCAKYRQRLDGRMPEPRVAGLYNSGTNAVERLLALNLETSKAGSNSSSLSLCVYALIPVSPSKLDVLLLNKTVVLHCRSCFRFPTFFSCSEVPWGKHLPLNLVECNQTTKQNHHVDECARFLYPAVLLVNSYRNWIAQNYTCFENWLSLRSLVLNS